MNRSLAIGLLIGLAAGSVAGALIAKSRKSESSKSAPPPAAPAPAPVAPKETPPPDPEIQTLRTQVAELKAKLAAKPLEPPAPAPTDTMPADWSDRFKALAKEGLGAFGDADYVKLAADLKRAGAKGIEALATILTTSESAQERFMAAALLEQMDDPAAIPALTKALQSDEDELVRRMSSHALAVMEEEGSLAALRTAMGEDKDWGVRVNSAYGVGKLGQTDGVKLLEEAWASTKVPAEYKLSVFGGLADIAAPSSAPIFRKILAESTDLSYLILTLRAVQKMKDTSFIEDLNRLAARSDVAANIRESARKAAESLAK